MLPIVRALTLAAVCLCSVALPAQTYTPKAIRLQGADAMDQAQILQLIALKEGAPVTKGEIEAAMQRLADSGLFADLSYTVDPTALVFVLKPVAGAQARPVRYANFVWWEPGQLEPLVEARVPLFRGSLPLTGELTTQVEAALVALLAEKGVSGASVEALQSGMGAPATALRITQPEVTLRQVHLAGVAPEAADQMHKITEQLSTREFDSQETPKTIVDNTADAHRNAGYLDVMVDKPTFSPPQQAARGYAVDATATVHPGAMYRISAIQFQGVEPQLVPEVQKVAGVRVGDPAQEMTLRIAEGLTERFYQNRGMLQAAAPAQVSKDASAHTAAYTFEVVPGPVYTFAGVDLSALPPEAQTHVQGAFHAHPGQIATAEVRNEFMQAVSSTGLKQVAFQQRLNPKEHTVIYAVAKRAH